MQGPSELGASGKLLHWDRSEDLRRIEVPTLVMGAEHDTMDPAHLRWMAGQLPRGRYHHSPEGSHIALVDDHETYMGGLVDFLHELEKVDASTTGGRSWCSRTGARSAESPTAPRARRSARRCSPPA